MSLGVKAPPYYLFETQFLDKRSVPISLKNNSSRLLRTVLSPDFSVNYVGTDVLEQAKFSESGPGGRLAHSAARDSFWVE